MKLIKLYNMGAERIEADTSMEKLVKTLRDIKILVKNQFMDEDLKFQIQQNHKNVIDLEEENNPVQDGI